MHLGAKHTPFDGCFTAGSVCLPFRGHSAFRGVRITLFLARIISQSAIDDMLQGSPLECVSNYCEATVICSLAEAHSHNNGAFEALGN
jgi:hypothetical protein